MDKKTRLEETVAEEAQTEQGRGIAASFAVSAIASLALAVVYVLGGQVQLEGVLLGLALGGLGLGLILWGKQLMPGRPYVEARKEMLSRPAEAAEAGGAFDRGEDEMRRRSFLGKMLGVALGALGIAALFPIRSLGTKPGRDLLTTKWTEGARLVTLDGLPVKAGELAVGGVLTVFPDGHTDAADSQTLLIRVDLADFEPPPGREEWSPQGHVAFSKICTHAGCPVGLYQPSHHELLCPCHQSVFAVLEAARPTAGPATRPLPQLPLDLDDDGYLVARGDFPEPVGPGFWNRPDA